MNDLLKNIDKIHTTELGAVRIKRNLSLDRGTDAAAWCRQKILDPSARIERDGKNWYVEADRCVITVNASAFTIITAHRREDWILS